MSDSGTAMAAAAAAAAAVITLMIAATVVTGNQLARWEPLDRRLDRRRRWEPSTLENTLGRALAVLGLSLLMSVIVATIGAGLAFGLVLPANRAWPAALAFVVAWLLVLFLFWLGTVLGALGARGLLLPVLSLHLLFTIPLLAARLLDWWWTATGVLGLALVIVSEGRASKRVMAREREREEQRLSTARQEIDRFVGTLPLVSGHRLSTPVAAWDLHAVFVRAGSAPQIAIHWRASANPYRPQQDCSLTVTLDRTDCRPSPSGTPVCSPFGASPNGPLTRYRSMSAYIFVRIDETEWRLAGTMTDDEALEAFGRLEPADKSAFWEAAKHHI